MKVFVFSLTSLMSILFFNCSSDSDDLIHSELENDNIEVNIRNNQVFYPNGLNINELFDQIDEMIESGLLLTLEMEYADLHTLDSLKIIVAEKVSSLSSAASIEEITKVYLLKKRKHFNFISSYDNKIGVFNWNINYANVKIEPYNSVFYFANEKVNLFQEFIEKDNQSQITEIQSLDLDSKTVYFLSMIKFDFLECNQKIVTLSFNKENLIFDKIFENGSNSFKMNGDVKLINKKALSFLYLCKPWNNSEKSEGNELVLEDGVFILKK